MSPGVGKTYAMLEAARAKMSDGHDVVAGVVETHGRAETERLLEGFEVLPPNVRHYRGSTFEEFDLESMLKRAPQIALVDELAHSNVPGGRHPKRYQDVMELLERGIDVFTTVNVQHLESRADAVESLSGARVRERVPDTVLELADEITLIDLSPEGLRQRLSEGKVYRGGKAATAADAFFAARNLAALREMALRSTAERVNLDLIKVLKQERETAPLPTGERVMVAVGSSPSSEKLVRWTKRYAATLNASWVAVHVERGEPLEPEDQERLEANLELARNLGAEVAASSGEDVVEGLLRTARRELVTQIVVGRSPSSIWRRLRRGGSLTDRLVSRSGPVAVHVVPAESERSRIRWERLREMPSRFDWKEYALAVGCAFGLGVVCYPFRMELGYWTVALLFLALTILGGFILSRGAVLLLALLSAMGWNFFFVQPQFTFAIHSTQDVLLFLVLLLVAVSMGQLTARLRALNLAERRRETRSFALYRFLDCLSEQHEFSHTLSEALAHASEVSGKEVWLVEWKETEAFRVLPDDRALGEKELGVVRWAVRSNAMAGAGTQNLPEMPALYLPVASGEHVYGVLRVAADGSRLPLASRDLLHQMARLLGRFLERERLREQAGRAEVLEASQRLQKTLLDTVSHELKTPLTIILGVLEQYIRQAASASEAGLLQHAEASAKRLLRNVNMLLDLTRMEGGVVRPKREFVDLDEISARLRDELAGEFGARAETVRFELRVHSLMADEALVFQLLNQLLRNALGHTPEGTLVECVVAPFAGEVHLVVRDEGPGLPAEVEPLFEAFSHGPQRRSKGLGLGLSIARRICETLGGSLRAENTEVGGARFVAILPYVASASESES